VDVLDPAAIERPKTFTNTEFNFILALEELSEGA
jgi:hypothetical protein